MEASSRSGGGALGGTGALAAAEQVGNRMGLPGYGLRAKGECPDLLWNSGRATQWFAHSTMVSFTAENGHYTQGK